MTSIVMVMETGEGWVLCVPHREKCSPGVRLPGEVTPRASAWLCEKAALTPAPSEQG